MNKLFEILVELWYWFLIFLSPFIFFGVISLVIIANTSFVYLSFFNLLLGFILGILLAEKIRRKYGCSFYIGKILSTS
jgi:hypothetical protein